MHLAVAEQLATLPPVVEEALWIAAKCADRFRHGDPRGVGAIEVRRIETSRHRSAPEVRGAEAQALFIGEGEHLDREGQALARVMQALDCGDGDDHAERPVVLAGIADGIEVGTQQERRLSAFVPATQVADVVPPNGHTRLAHPLAHDLVGASHRLGGKGSRDGAGLLAAPGQVVTSLDHDSGQRHDNSVKVISCAPSHKTRRPRTGSWSLPS